MFAARREHVVSVIAPALARGDWVLCDRFTDATFAYQGVGMASRRIVLRELARARASRLQSRRHAVVRRAARRVAGATRANAEREGRTLDKFEREERAFFDVRA